MIRMRQIVGDQILVSTVMRLQQKVYFFPLVLVMFGMICILFQIFFILNEACYARAIKFRESNKKLYISVTVSVFPKDP